MGNRLDGIQMKWSSQDPEEAIVGFVGKVVVEVGLFIILASVFAGVVYAATALFPVDLPSEVAAGPVWIASIGGLYYKSFCTIIQKKTPTSPADD